MRFGPELKTFKIDKPVYAALTIYVPEFVAARDEYYGDIDFTFSAVTSLCLSHYEYGYVFRLLVLGFGFEIWIARNI